MIYPDVVCAIHKAATELGIKKRQLITNGFFSKKFERIEEIVQELEKSGVTDLLLSVDAFHQETIPLKPVKYFAECVSKTKIHMKLSPAWLVSVDDNNPYIIRTREVLKEFTSYNVPIGEGNIVFASGNALKYLGEYFKECEDYSSPYDEEPCDIQTVCFSPNGNVLNGNVYKDDILDVLDRYQP